MSKIIYPTTIVITLARAINKNEESYQWLIKNGYKELAAVTDCFVYNNRKSYKWLSDFNYSFLITFIDAAHEDHEAFNYLMTNDYKEWAATINAANGNEKAIIWLKKSNFEHFVALAKAISQISILNSDNDDQFDEGVDEFSIYNLFSKILRNSLRKK